MFSDGVIGRSRRIVQGVPWPEYCVIVRVAFAAIPSSPLEPKPTDLSIDAIFMAYDGHSYDINGASHRVSVHGVYEDGCCQWVQLCVEGPLMRFVTLRLGKNSDPGSAIISRVA